MTDPITDAARVLYQAGAWCGVCEYEGWDTCADCRATLTGYANALAEAWLLVAPDPLQIAPRLGTE